MGLNKSVFNKTNTLQKAMENDQRCQDLKKRKEDLLKLRRKNAHEAKVKKDKLMEILEKSKTRGSSGIKKILRSLDGNNESPVQVKITQDIRNDIPAPPEIPSHSFEKEHSPTAPYKSPYINDDFLGIGHITVQDQRKI